MISLKSIEFTLPTKIIFGSDVVDRLGEITKEYSEKIFLITNGRVMRKTGILDKIENLLKKSDVEFIIYDEVERDPSNETIDEIGTLVRQSRVKLIVAVGGTSVINTAKAVSYLGLNDGKVVEYLNGGIGSNESIPVIVVPTIPGILQQLNNEFILNDDNDNIKKIYKNSCLYPLIALIDPKLTTTLPMSYTVSSGFAILSNAIEAFISTASNSISDSMALKAIEIIGSNLKRIFLHQDDVSARVNIMMAGIISGIALLTAKAGTCEAMALSLSSKEKIYKNIAHAIMLPHVMEFNLTSMPNKYVQIAKSLGEDISNITVVEAAIKAIEGVRKLLFDLKVPQKLSDYKVSKENLPIISSVARRYQFMNFTPLPISKEDILNILLTAF